MTNSCVFKRNKLKKQNTRWHRLIHHWMITGPSVRLVPLESHLLPHQRAQGTSPTLSGTYRWLIGTFQYLQDHFSPSITVISCYLRKVDCKSIFQKLITWCYFLHNLHRPTYFSNLHDDPRHFQSLDLGLIHPNLWMGHENIVTYILRMC